MALANPTNSGQGFACQHHKCVHMYKHTHKPAPTQHLCICTYSHIDTHT